MSYILSSGGFKEVKDSTAPFIKSDTFPPKYYLNHSEEYTDTKDQSNTQTLSSTITSLDEFDFFRKESLFEDSESEDPEDHNDINQPFTDMICKSTDDNVFGDVNPQNNKVFKSTDRQNENYPNSDVSDDKGTDSCNVKEQENNDLNRKHVNTPTEHTDTGTTTNISEDLIDGNLQPIHRTQLQNNNAEDETDTSKLIQNKKLEPKNHNHDSVTYNYEPCCHLEGDDDGCQRCCEKIVLPAIINTERRSEIHFMLTQEYSEYSWMNLYTSKIGHFIEVVNETAKYPSRMSLRNRDKILGIHFQAIERYEHDIVLEMFRYLLHTPTEESISLIVERREQNGNVVVLEIKVDVAVTTRGNPIVRIVSSILFSSPFKLHIKYVTLKRRFQCRMFSGGRTNMYITSDKGRLYMSTLKHEDEKKSVFVCFQFHGVCVRYHGGRTGPIFFGVFQSSDNKFIMASSASKLSLVSASNNLDTSVREITRADPRFFKVVKTGTGNTYFESLLYRGSYWTLTGRELGLAKRSSLDVLMRNDSQFDFVPI